MGFKNSEKTYLEVDKYAIKNVRLVSDKLVTFTLRGDGVSLYNVRLVEGVNGRFISASQHKGSDGRWYNDYGLYISEDDQKKLIDDVLAQLE